MNENDVCEMMVVIRFHADPPFSCVPVWETDPYDPFDPFMCPVDNQLQLPTNNGRDRISPFLPSNIVASMIRTGGSVPLI